MTPAPKICRRCKIAKLRGTWTCRTCGARCCEHLCALKVPSVVPGQPTIALATCGTCKR